VSFLNHFKRSKFDYLLRLPLCSRQRWVSFNGYQLARDGKQKEFYNIGGISGSLSLSIRHEAACTSGRGASFRTFGGDPPRTDISFSLFPSPLGSPSCPSFGGSETLRKVRRARGASALHSARRECCRLRMSLCHTMSIL